MYHKVPKICPLQGRIQSFKKGEGEAYIQVFLFVFFLVQPCGARSAPSFIARTVQSVVGESGGMLLQENFEI